MHTSLRFLRRAAPELLERAPRVAKVVPRLTTGQFLGRTAVVGGAVAAGAWGIDAWGRRAENGGFIPTLGHDVGQFGGNVVGGVVGGAVEEVEEGASKLMPWILVGLAAWLILRERK